MVPFPKWLSNYFPKYADMTRLTWLSRCHLSHLRCVYRYLPKFVRRTRLLRLTYVTYGVCISISGGVTMRCACYIWGYPVYFIHRLTTISTRLFALSATTLVDWWRLKSISRNTVSYRKQGGKAYLPWCGVNLLILRHMTCVCSFHDWLPNQLATSPWL